MTSPVFSLHSYMNLLQCQNYSLKRLFHIHFIWKRITEHPLHITYPLLSVEHLLVPTLCWILGYDGKQEGRGLYPHRTERQAFFIPPSMSPKAHSLLFIKIPLTLRGSAWALLLLLIAPMVFLLQRGSHGLQHSHNTTRQSVPLTFLWDRARYIKLGNEHEARHSARHSTGAQ